MRSIRPFVALLATAALFGLASCAAGFGDDAGADDGSTDGDRGASSSDSDSSQTEDEQSVDGEEALGPIEAPEDVQDGDRTQDTVPDDGEPVEAPRERVRQWLVDEEWKLASELAAEARERPGLTGGERDELAIYQRFAEAKTAQDASTADRAITEITMLDPEFGGGLAAVQVEDYLLAEAWAEAAALSDDVVSTEGVAGEIRTELMGYQGLAQAQLAGTTAEVATAYELVVQVNPELAEDLVAEGAVAVPPDALDDGAIAVDTGASATEGVAEGG